jgi:hypothetical protein
MRTSLMIMRLMTFTLMDMILMISTLMLTHQWQYHQWTLDQWYIHQCSHINDSITDVLNHDLTPSFCQPGLDIRNHHPHVLPCVIITFYKVTKKVKIVLYVGFDPRTQWLGSLGYIPTRLTLRCLLIYARSLCITLFFISDLIFDSWRKGH